MQVSNEGNIIERDLYYLTKLYSEQLKNKENYKNAKKVIIINLLGYNFFKTNSPYHKITLKENKNKENPGELDQWMWLFSGKKEMIKMALSKGAQAIKKAYKELEYLSQDEQARQEYDEYVEAKFNNSMIMYFEREKGIEKGKKQEKIQIAKNMLKSNLSVETIMAVTGLTEKEIEDIKQDLEIKK